MNNPYIILGVSPNDPEDMIKKAYRSKAFEIETSNLSEDAKQKKMSELDEAFDAVFNEKRGTSSSYSKQGSYGCSTQFPDVRQQIADGRIDDAEIILNGIPEGMRNAEWYYLKGLIHRRRGWLNEAYSCFNTAVTMDPQNAEYKQTFDSMKRNANGGYKINNDYSPKGDGCCSGDCCSDLCTLWCCDKICECFGCDLCGCC